VRRALPLCLIALFACRDPNTRPTNMPPPIPDPRCGDAILQEGEDCDGSEQGVASSCQDLGFDTGTLVCNQATCRYDTSRCVKRCGNGVLDLGEACDGPLGLEACTTWGFNACSDTCTVDTRHCVMGTFEAGPETVMAKGGPAVLGDLAPTGPGDLVLAVPGFTRVEIIPWNMTRGFEPVTSRKLSFQRSPVEVELVDSNRDGTLDVATINADGTVDVLVSQGSSYALTALDGGACAGAKFLPTDGTGRAEVVTLGCGGYGVASNAGVTRTLTPNATAFGQAADGVLWADATPELHWPDGGAVALPSTVSQLRAADFDGDLDLDLAVVTVAGVELYENTGAGFAARAAFTTSMPSELRAVDLDQDGRVDLFWASGDDLVLRRNRGAWVFSQATVPAGMGIRRSIALGDADGDQDLDVAVTLTTGPESTTTRLFLNRVR
jgi:hypothetical protein